MCCLGLGEPPPGFLQGVLELQDLGLVLVFTLSLGLISGRIIRLELPLDNVLDFRGAPGLLQRKGALRRNLLQLGLSEYLDHLSPWEPAGQQLGLK